jgi:hypothetical protein
MSVPWQSLIFPSYRSARRAFLPCHHRTFRQKCMLVPLHTAWWCLSVMQVFCLLVGSTQCCFPSPLLPWVMIGHCHFPISISMHHFPILGPYCTRLWHQVHLLGNIYYNWNLIFSVMIFREETFGRWLGHKDSTLINWISALQRGPKEFICFFYHARTQWKDSCLWTKKWAPIWYESAGVFILIFPDLRTVRNKFCC